MAVTWRLHLESLWRQVEERGEGEGSSNVLNAVLLVDNQEGPPVTAGSALWRMVRASTPFEGNPNPNPNPNPKS